MVKKINIEKILQEILEIESGNKFLKYIVNRVQDNNYRGWHVSQHNRYDIRDIEIILRSIYDLVGKNYFAIPPGDYDKNVKLPDIYIIFQNIVKKINIEIGRGTINSVKKNFFPDIAKMGFLFRDMIKINKNDSTILHGKITNDAVDFIQSRTLIDKYKKFTDGIDKLFGQKISDLAEMIYLSKYMNKRFSIYEFMFIFSDNDEEIDKIELLESYRSLKKCDKDKTIDLIKKYAVPENFNGNKTEKRDFHNWKNQTQQIMNLLKTTVYFQVEPNKYFQLNIGSTGFFQEYKKRSVIPKKEYFSFHKVNKRNKFELHHIIPFRFARDKYEFKMIDDYKNLIYLHKGKHKEITKNNDRYLILSINADTATFTDLERKNVVTSNNNDNAIYSREEKILNLMRKHNVELLKLVFDIKE